MPIFYGEGPKAFRRLQEEIIKQSNDVTILAHSLNKPTTDLLAKKPADFEGLGAFRPRLGEQGEQVEFSITKRGLQMVGDVPIYFVDEPRRFDYATCFIPLGHNKAGDLIALCLRKIGVRLFHRNGTEQSRGFGITRHSNTRFFIAENADCYILLDGNPSVVKTHEDPISDAIHLSTTSIRTHAQDISSGSMMLHELVPRASYDWVRRVFLRQRVANRNRGTGQDVVIAVKGSIRPDQGSSRVKVITLCRYSSLDNPAQAVVFEADKHPHLEAFLFASINKEDSVVWQLLNVIYPEVRQFSDTVHICPVELEQTTRRFIFKASITWDRIETPSISRQNMMILQVSITEL